MAAPGEPIPSDPSHPDNALYCQLLTDVTQLGQWKGERNANVAAALYAQVKGDPYFPEQVSRVVAGDPKAATPSVFAIYDPPYGAQPMRASVPLTAATSPAAGSLRPLALPASQVDAQGMLTDPAVVKDRIPALEHARLNGPEAIVMHRTESSTVQSTLDGYKDPNNPQPNGAHFLIGKDGTITQTTSLDQQTWHVGKIRSRGDAESTLSETDQAWHEKTGSSPSKVDTHENGNPYPIRYPINGDSVGIEVVGSYDDGSKTWDKPTPEQSASIDKLAGILQQQYGLDDHDIYKHDTISYKTQGEGDGLSVPGAGTDAPVVQPAGPTR